MKELNNFRQYLNEGLDSKDKDIKEEQVEEMDKHSEDSAVDDLFPSKMTKEALKEKIKAEILSTLSEEDSIEEAEEDEVEDDLDAELDDAEGDIEADVDVDIDADVETGEPDLSDEAGLSEDELEIQNSLKIAYDNAIQIGDEKLANQIANTITFFTRAHVVPRA